MRKMQKMPKTSLRCPPKESLTAEKHLSLRTEKKEKKPE